MQGILPNETQMTEEQDRGYYNQLFLCRVAHLSGFLLLVLLEAVSST